jgi:hypothetical protein
MKIQKHFYLLAILLVAVAMAGVVPAIARAEGTVSQLTLSVTADKTTAYAGDNVTFTYRISNTGVSTVENLTVSDSRIGSVALSTTTLAAGENITATAVYTVKAGDLPGPLKNDVTGAGVSVAGNNVTVAASVSVDLKAADVDDDNGDKDDDTAKTKAEWLREKGVHGKGIDHAPGLQKPFNENSQAAVKAGGIGKDKTGHGHGHGHGGDGED